MRGIHLAAWIFAAGSAILPLTAAQAQYRYQEWPGPYYERQDLRGDYRDLRHNYAEVDRLRADIARDQYRLEMARRAGDHWAAKQILRDLHRDQHALNALLKDIRHDRRDIRRDQRDLYRDGYR